MLSLVVQPFNDQPGLAHICSLALAVPPTCIWGYNVQVITTNDAEIKRPELVGAAKSPRAVWEEDEKSRERARGMMPHTSRLPHFLRAPCVPCVVVRHRPASASLPLPPSPSSSPSLPARSPSLGLLLLLAPQLRDCHGRGASASGLRRRRRHDDRKRASERGME